MFNNYHFDSLPSYLQDKENSLCTSNIIASQSPSRKRPRQGLQVCI